MASNSNGNGNGHSPNGNGHPDGNGAADGNGHAHPETGKPKVAGSGGKSTKANYVTKPGILGVPPRRPKAGVPAAKTKPREYQPSTFELEAYYHVTSGKTYKETGKLLGVPYVAIYRLTKRIDAWLAPQYLDAIRELKANHVERLMHIYHEAMAAWEESKKPVDSTATKGSEVTQFRRWQTGIPFYLTQAREALSDIRKILGADAPLKVEHSGEIRVAGQQLTDIVAQAKKRLGESMYRLSALSKSSPN